MLKTIRFTAIQVLFVLAAHAQVLYYESFSALSLSTYTASGVSFNYSFPPANFSYINDNYKNNSTTYNKPFTAPALLRQGWAVYNNPTVLNDTFLVSTSWLDTTVATAVNRWVITPPINNIAVNSVLSWRAMCPDVNNRDGYEVYITTNTTGTLSTSDFSTSNKVFAIADPDNGGTGEQNAWTVRGLNLAAYAGQNIRVAFKTISKDKFQLWIDDIKVENLSKSLDLAVTDMNYTRYVLTGSSNQITASVMNEGYTSINAATLSYRIGNNTPVSQPFTFSPPLAPYAISQVTLAIPFSLPTTGYNTLKVFITDVNGVTDNSQANDTVASFVTAMASSANKKALLKKYVSANEGWTPDAQVLSDNLASADTNLVVMAVHASDSMMTAAGNTMVSLYNPYIPSAAIDNKYWPDMGGITLERANWQGKITTQEAVVAPVAITVLNKTYNTSTGVMSFDVKLDFVAQLKGSYHLNTSLVENNVCGPFNINTVNGWNQLSNLYSVPTSPYYQQGFYYNGEAYILNAWQYKHHQVMIAALDGAAGDNTTIPVTGVGIGQSITKHYSYTLTPVSNGASIYNPDNIYITAYVEEYNTQLNKCLVVNAGRSKLNTNPESVPVTVKEEAAIAGGFSLFPNPAGSQVNLLLQDARLDCRLEILSQLGDVLYTATVAAGTSLTPVDIAMYPPGLYFVTLENGIHKVTKKLVIAR